MYFFRMYFEMVINNLVEIWFYSTIRIIFINRKRKKKKPFKMHLFSRFSLKFENIYIIWYILYIGHMIT